MEKINISTNAIILMTDNFPRSYSIVIEKVVIGMIEYNGLKISYANTTSTMYIELVRN